MSRIKKFGEAVRTLRNSRGYTQEELAEKAGIHVNSVSLVERGLTPPTLDTICSIADALEIRVSDLVKEMETR
ncbi:MAG: helix-turn-helix domain-containing protein [Curvibacter sp.]|jgi:transcriptional regulator with XRE-family HTH domain|nr:helix-turn-helix transcriptional regulator [Curvibacter sp.]